MDNQQFIASLVHSLAWPAAIVAVAFMFRGQIRSLLRGQLRRLKAGPGGVEMEFDRMLSEVRVELEQPDVPIADEPAPAGGMSVHAVAVIDAYNRVEVGLRRRLAEVGATKEAQGLGAAGLARLAYQNNIITRETVNAVEGISVLRNLAVHGHGDVTAKQATEYEVLTDAVLFAINRRIEPGIGPPGPAPEPAE